MNRLELQDTLSARVKELDYSYERFSNGACEYIVYPTGQEGPPMRYQFDNAGEGRL